MISAEQKGSCIFLNSPELVAIPFAILGVIADGSLFICYTNRKPHPLNDNRTVVKQKLKFVTTKTAITTTTTTKTTKMHPKTVVSRDVILSLI